MNTEVYASMDCVYDEDCTGEMVPVSIPSALVSPRPIERGRLAISLTPIRGTVRAQVVLVERLPEWRYGSYKLRRIGAEKIYEGEEAARIWAVVPEEVRNWIEANL